MASKLTRNVFLIGFMGAGKSTVARRIARTEGVVSLDVDSYIERSQERSIKSIFDEGGEPLFRSIETETLKSIAESDEPKLISCGGGVVVTDENVRIMGDNGFVIYLDVTADEAASRISDKTSRPLFNDIEGARKLCNSRIPLYREAADAVVSTSGKSAYEIARDVKRLLYKEGILCQQPR